MELNFKEKAYQTLKDKIITCELMPGAVVDQNELMKEIGVSRTPVREAVNALEQEGLLVVMPRRGVIVSNISIQEISHIYTVRETVEPMIARLATPEVDTDTLNEFYRVFKNGSDDFNLITRNDYLLHKYFAERTGNSYLIRLMDNVLSHNMRIVVLGAKIPDRLHISNMEHLEIIEKMLDGDAEGAEMSMIRHITSARKIASKVNGINV